MITADENAKVREIRKLAEEGSDVSHDDRQWILDLHKREGIPMEKEVVEGAKSMGFNVDGIKVLSND